MDITLIGTGLIGFNIAKRLKLSNPKNNISVYNRRIEKALPLKEFDINILENLSDIKSDFIISVLTNYQANLDILSEMDNIEGKTFIQMGTISARENFQLSNIVAFKKANYIESPVLGSKKEAETGKLLIMWSGDKNLSTKCEPIFKLLSEKCMYIGEIGKASNLKLALNQLIASLTASFSLSLGIVEKSGIDVDIFMDLLRNSALYAPTFDKKLDNMLNRNFENPNFPTKHLLKDVELILDTSKELGLNSEILNSIKTVVEDSIKLNLQDKDYSSIFNAIVPEN